MFQVLHFYLHFKVHLDKYRRVTSEATVRYLTWVDGRNVLEQDVALLVVDHHLFDLSRVQTDRFQVPTTGTGSRLPETGQCVLSSGSRF